MTTLSAQNLHKSFGHRAVVNGLSLEVNSGEIVGLLGPNGAGKTTSFYMIAGLVPADSGSVFIDQEDISDLPIHQRARLGLGYLPQEASVFRKLTVAQNLIAIIENRTDLDTAAQKDLLESLLAEFHITHIRDSLGMALSGGERRRVEIARALTMSPRFILLDEPFAGVDPIAVEDIQILVAKLKRRNIGVLITDHNANETLSITDYVYIQFEGKTFTSGTSEVVAKNAGVKERYFGRHYEYKRKIFSFEELT